MTTVSALSVDSRASLSALGRLTFSRECSTNVVLSTKNISRVSSTSINEITLISKSSSRREPMRMGSAGLRGRGFRRGGAAARCRTRGGQVVQQRRGFLLHLDDVTADPGAEVAMQHIGRDRDDQAERRADEGFADAAGHLGRV